MRLFFEWCDKLAVSDTIRNSKILFPIVETFHLLALTVLLGSVLLVALRLMGSGLRKQSVTAVAAALFPIINWSLAVMLVSGFLLFCSEAIKCYENPPFFFKMTMLAASVVFHFAVVRPAANARARAGRVRLVASGLTSLVCWFSVAVGGRAIGFY
jgi:hypothetical protein